MTLDPLEDGRQSVVQFWDGQKYRFCPNCQAIAFKFAEAYAEHVWTARAAREKELRKVFDELDSLLRRYRHALHGEDCECLQCRKMLRALIVLEQDYERAALSETKPEPQEKP